MGCKPSKPRSADSNEWNAAYEQSVRQVTTRRKESVKTVKKGDVRRGSTGDTIVVVDGKVTSVNGYAMGKVLGKGAFGEVFLASKGGDKYAVKVLKKSALAKNTKTIAKRPGAKPGGGTSGAFDTVATEIATMRKINHPNLVHMFDVVVDVNRHEVYVVIEFIDGGASQKMDAEGNPIPLPEATMWSHMRHLVLGLEFLHMQGIVHRDIKPENLLVTKEPAFNGIGMLKIADFGTANILSDDDENGKKKTQGTPLFFSPEVCTKDASGTFDTRAVDLWAVGVTVFVWCCGKMPFMAATEYLLMEEIQQCAETTSPPTEASPMLASVITGLLTKDPAKRLTLNQLRLHAWLTSDGKEPLPQQPTTAIHVTEEEIELAFTASKYRQLIAYQSAAGPSALAKATNARPDWKREGENVIRKRTNETDASLCAAIASDGDLAHHMPVIYGIDAVQEGGDTDRSSGAPAAAPPASAPAPSHAAAAKPSLHDIRMQDLAGGMTRPCAMLIVMGCRTVVPADFEEEGSAPSADLLEKMRALDASAPTAEEEAAGGVSRRRYLQFLDSSSSTASLGFRIDAAKTVVDGELATLPLPEGVSLETLRDEASVQAAIGTFLQDDYALCKAVLGKLQALTTALERSAFFSKHVLLRSTLLMVYDDAARTKLELKMVSFGDSFAAADGEAVSHDTLGWSGAAGSHEDGYLAGARSLSRALVRLSTAHATANREAIAYQSAAGPSALAKATGRVPDWKRVGEDVIKKRTNQTDASLCAAIGSDGSLANHIPVVHSIEAVDDGALHDIRMQDLAGGMTRPCAMLIVMGCRTVVPADFEEEGSAPSADLLEKMRALDASAPTAEEEAAGGVSRRRYLQFLDSSSSTASLGFRIDAAKTVVDGELATLPLPEGVSLETLRDEASVQAAIGTFLQDDYALCKAVLGKLQALTTALERSAFFSKHVLLRSTLLMVYDDAARTKLELKMVSFGDSFAAADGEAVSHDTLGWSGAAGSHEDGYLAGARSLVRLFNQMHPEMQVRNLKGHNRNTTASRERYTAPEESTSFAERNRSSSRPSSGNRAKSAASLRPASAGGAFRFPSRQASAPQPSSGKSDLPSP